MPSCRQRFGAILAQPATRNVTAHRGRVAEVQDTPPMVGVDGALLPYLDNGWSPAVGDFALVMSDTVNRVCVGPRACSITLIGTIARRLEYATVNSDGTTFYGQTSSVNGRTVYAYDITNGLAETIVHTYSSPHEAQGLGYDHDAGVLWSAASDPPNDFLLYSDGSLASTNSMSTYGYGGEPAYCGTGGMRLASGGNTYTSAFGLSISDDLALYAIGSGGGLSSLATETLPASSLNTTDAAWGTPNGGLFVVEFGDVYDFTMGYWSGGGLSHDLTTYAGMGYHMTAAGLFRFDADEVVTGMRIPEATLSATADECAQSFADADTSGAFRSVGGMDSSWRNGYVGFVSSGSTDVYQVTAP